MSSTVSAASASARGWNDLFGRPPNHVRRYYASFRYQAGSWDRTRRVIAKVEWHPGEFHPRIGFIVTNFRRPAQGGVVFYNQRDTAKQWIKEGKTTLADARHFLIFKTLILRP